MPIIELDVVGSAPEDTAQRVADALGTLLEHEPGRVWVKLRRIPDHDYAENHVKGPEPVFVTITQQQLARRSDREILAANVARSVALTLRRDPNLVHVCFANEGGGRLSFGGEMTPAAPERIQTGAPWEAIVGYARAVRRGPYIAVTGTAPVEDDGSTHAPGDAYAQTLKCLEIIEDVLRRLGASTHDVIRTRIFVTDISRWEEIGRAHAEVFGSTRPATTMVEVARLIAPDMLVEIEADAIA